MSGLRTVAMGAAALALSTTGAHAAHLVNTYKVNFQSLNGSGVDGTATLTLNNDRTQLTVQINATGLEPGGVHPGHIHGKFENGAPANSVTPPPSADTDGDGFVELAEGLPFYGPIILSLGNVDPDGDGSVNYSQTFDLLDSMNFGTIGDTDDRFGRADLLGADLASLDLREIVLHGRTVPGVGAGTPGEVDGIAGYKAVLPVAAGQIGAIPEPGTWAMMILGLGGVGFALRRRESLVKA